MFTDRAEDIWVLIPANNEAATIRDVVEGALRYAKHVIVVDDGSTDGTAPLVEDLPIILIRQEINGGKASALMTGFNRAVQQGAKAVITIDADGQHNPDEIPLFIHANQSRPNHVIVGSRLWNRAAVPAIRYWANRVANFWVSWASGLDLEDAQSGFRLYPSALLESVAANHDSRHGFTFEAEFLINAARAGYNISYVRISVTYPKNHLQQSHYRHVLDNLRMTRMIAVKLALKLKPSNNVPKSPRRKN